MQTSKVLVFVFFGSVAVMIGHVIADNTNDVSINNSNTVTTNPPTTPSTTTPSTPSTTTSTPSTSPDTEMKCEETPKTACQQAFDNIDTLCYDFTGVCSDYFSVPDIQQRDGFFAVREAALYIAYTKCNQINSAMYYYSDGVDLEKDKVGGTGSSTSSISQTPSSTTTSPTSQPSTMSTASSPTPATSSPTPATSSPTPTTSSPTPTTNPPTS